MHRPGRLVVPTSVVALVVLTGCSEGDGTDPPDPGPVVATIVVTPSDPVVEALGESVQFAAEARDAGGTPVVGVTFAWASSNEEVATIDAAGRATSLDNGVASITASAQGKTGEVQLTVAQVASADESSFALSAPSAVADGSATIDVAITLVDANGHALMGETAAIGVSGAGHTVVQPPPTDAEGKTTGSVRATTAGPRTISVHVDPDGADIPLSQTAEVEFLEPEPVVASVLVTPEAPSLHAFDQTVDLQAEAREADGTPIPDVTVMWSSWNPAVATVDAAGRATALGNGIATITATVDGKTGGADLTVAQVASPDGSSFAVGPESAVADGAAAIDVAITIRDANGHPIAGAFAVIDVSGTDNVIDQPPATDAAGQTSGSVRSTTAGARTVSVRAHPGDADIALTQTAEVEFTAVAACPDLDGDEICDATPCDAAIPINDADPGAAAQALGLCAAASASTEYGLVSAAYERADGTTIDASVQMGILRFFGSVVTPQEGDKLVALSTGTARVPGQLGACGDESCAGTGAGTAPAGFPLEVAGCPYYEGINDDVAFVVRLRAPINARGFSVRSKFYSFEYPEWVCSTYNDQAVAIIDPKPAGVPLDGNVIFDAMGSPLSVNTGFFDVCQGCPLGTAELTATGFDTWGEQPAGGTRWLRTTVPVEGGTEFVLRFIIWDTGDAQFDSTLLLDDFRWLVEPVDNSTGP